MKKSIIEEIFYIYDEIVEKAEPSKELKKLSDKAYGFYKNLNETLSDDQIEIFDNFLNAEMDLNAENDFKYFKEGFKIGLLLASECF